MQFGIARNLLRRSSSAWLTHACSQHNKARVVLLPEVPADTAETNQFIRCIESGSLPDFDSWTLKNSIDGVAKFGLEYEGWLLDHLEPSEADPQLDTTSFASLMDALERSSAPVDAAWYTARQKYLTAFYGNDSADDHFRGLQKMMTRLAYTRYSTQSFHEALKQLLASGRVTDPWRVRLVENYLLECNMNGLNLKPHKRHQLSQIRERLQAKTTEYTRNVQTSSVKLADRTLRAVSELRDAPEYVLRWLADNPEQPIRFPFSITYAPFKFALSMKYCRRRLLRHSWWNAVNSRAAFLEDVPLQNNSVMVEEMRRIRQREAKWLGCKTYADLQLRVCMARSVDEVQEFLTKFGDKASNALDAIYEDMCNLAEAEGESSREPPDAWDLSYYAGLVATNKYKLNQHQFAEYFTYPETMKRILQSVGRLFGIEFRGVTKCTPRWHPTVDAYEIRRGASDAPIGYLYVDPFMRRGKFPLPLAVEGRPKSDVAGSIPIVHLNLALISPKADKPSLIYLDQMSDLAFQLGKALQYVLSSAPYSHMVGDRLVEWDCKDVCGRVVQLLVASRPQFLVDISRHYQTGGKVDLETSTNLVKGSVIANLPVIVRQVVDSELDSMMYASGKFWRDVYNELHAKYLPYKWDKSKGDEFVCNFGGYVTENVAAKYYSVLWSKMLASDIVDAFDEAGNAGEEELLRVGDRYADLYLTNGGRHSQRETFERFRGREAALEPMLKYYVSF